MKIDKIYPEDLYFRLKNITSPNLLVRRFAYVNYCGQFPKEFNYLVLSFYSSDKEESLKKIKNFLLKNRYLITFNKVKGLLHYNNILSIKRNENSEKYLEKQFYFLG